MLKIGKPLVFDWDKGNIKKNLCKHNISIYDCEEVFRDTNKKILEDIKHSSKENRFIILGKTGKEKILFVVFTLRGSKVRIISARPLNKKEHKLYEKTT